MLKPKIDIPRTQKSMKGTWWGKKWFDACGSGTVVGKGWDVTASGLLTWFHYSNIL